MASQPACSGAGSGISFDLPGSFMRILFINNSFPGQFEALAGYLASRPENTVFFASSYGRRDFSMKGVRRILLKAAHDRMAKGREELVRQWTWLVNVGREAQRAFLSLGKSGFAPDMVLFSGGCGESFFVQDAFPASFRAAYLELDRTAEEGRADEKRSLAFLAQGMALLHGHAAFVLSGDARCLPEFLRPSAGVIPPFADVDFFRPESAGAFSCDGVCFSRKMELVSIDLKGLPETDPLPAVLSRLLKERQDCHILLNRWGEVGPRLEMFAELLRSWPGRVHLRTMLNRTEYRDMLAASTVRIIPAPVSRTRDLLEALSCETLLLARPSAAAGAALLPGRTMLAWPEGAEEQLCLLHTALNGGQELDAMRRMGREAVKREHAQDVILPRHETELLSAYQRWKAAAHPSC